MPFIYSCRKYLYAANYRIKGIIQNQRAVTAESSEMILVRMRRSSGLYFETRKEMAHHAQEVPPAHCLRLSRRRLRFRLCRHGHHAAHPSPPGGASSPAEPLHRRARESPDLVAAPAVVCFLGRSVFIFFGVLPGFDPVGFRPPHPECLRHPSV